MAAVVLGATSLVTAPPRRPFRQPRRTAGGRDCRRGRARGAWSTDEAPIFRIELGTSHQGYFLDLGYGGTRNDVANAYPERPWAQNSGYAGALQTLYDDLAVRGNLSLAEALRVGGLIEEIDVSDLGVALSVPEAADIISVYENLSQCSDNHLRAFVNALV